RAQRDVTPPSARNRGALAESCQVWGWGERTPLQAAPASRFSVWLSLQLEYAGASPVQLRFLRLHSRRATQKVSYSCRPAPEPGRPHPDKEIRFLADSREHSYAATLHGCMLDNESHVSDTILQFSTEELRLLPLRDVAVFHDGDASHHFGFTVGPVCFS
ncbi:CO5A1 protein, partial [Ptilonorhynchus violaceus]|nr:CO5A1 protein [Ptilonorhynchus violaceus]